MKAAASVIAALILLCLPADSRASQKGLLLLGDYQQSLDLSYRYNGSQTVDRYSNQHQLYEEYHFKVPYGVVKPAFLTGQFSAGLRFDQTSASSTGDSGSSAAGLSFLYDIDGVLLKLSPTPVNFQIQSRIENIPRSFGPGYELTTDLYTAGAAVKNRFLPINASYSRLVSKTSGLDNDRIQTHDAFFVTIRNAYKELSSTEISLTTYRDRTTDIAGAETSNTDNFDVSAQNTLWWGRSGKDYSLASLVRLVEQGGDSEFSTGSWNESLQGQLGKALRAGLSYSYDKRNNQSQESRTNTGRAWLRHRLFESLTTQVEVQAREQTSTSGSEQDVTGSVSITYMKKLSPSSNLQLAVFERYGVTDRTLDTGKVTVFDESHTIDLFQINMFIAVANQDVIPGSIVIRNRDPLRRPTPYVPGIDFQFDVIGGLKGVRLTGADFIDNDVLLITYDVAVNPDIEFSTESRGVSADLTTSGEKYRYYGSWQGTRQDVLSGRADLVNLTNSDIYTAGFEDRFDWGSFSAAYTRTVSDSDNHQTVRGGLRRREQLGEGLYSLYLTDTLTVTTPNQTTTGPAAGSRTENILNAGGNYSRNIFGTTLLFANADYSHVSGDSTRNDFSTGLNLRWRYGKLAFTFLSQIILKSFQGTTKQEERVRMNLTRYF